MTVAELRNLLARYKPDDLVELDLGMLVAEPQVRAYIEHPKSYGRTYLEIDSNWTHVEPADALRKAVN
jgi:hypothetical protein